MPFSNLTFDIVVPSTLRNEPVVIGGRYTGDTYGDFKPKWTFLIWRFAK